MAQAETDENGSATPLTSAEKKELAELRKKTCQLRDGE
jgi:fatty-acyl-CoA synthase